MSNFSKAEKQALLECYYDKRTVYEVIEHLGNLNEISAILEDSPILKHKPYALSFFNAP